MKFTKKNAARFGRLGALARKARKRAGNRAAAKTRRFHVYNDQGYPLTSRTRYAGNKFDSSLFVRGGHALPLGEAKAKRLARHSGGRAVRAK